MLPILLSMKPVYLETCPSSCLEHFSHLSILKQLADLSSLRWAALLLSLNWNKAYYLPLPTLLHSKLLWSCSLMSNVLLCSKTHCWGCELWTEHRLQVDPSYKWIHSTIPFRVYLANFNSLAIGINGTIHLHTLDALLHTLNMSAYHNSSFMKKFCCYVPLWPPSVSRLLPLIGEYHSLPCSFVMMLLACHVPKTNGASWIWTKTWETVSCIYTLYITVMKTTPSLLRVAMWKYHVQSWHSKTNICDFPWTIVQRLS